MVFLNIELIDDCFRMIAVQDHHILGVKVKVNK